MIIVMNTASDDRYVGQYLNNILQFSFLTFKFGVKGSGNLMFLGNALRMRFLIWMQFGGMTSQKLKW